MWAVCGPVLSQTLLIAVSIVSVFVSSLYSYKGCVCKQKKLLKHVELFKCTCFMIYDISLIITYLRVYMDHTIDWKLPLLPKYKQEACCPFLAVFLSIATLHVCWTSQFYGSNTLLPSEYIRVSRVELGHLKSVSVFLGCMPFLCLTPLTCIQFFVENVVSC